MTTSSVSPIKYLDNFSLGNNFDHLFKCLLLGDSATGKSSLCDRQVEKFFDKKHQSIPTCGVDFKTQAFDWEGKVIKLQIWDTAGQERFRAIVNSYYRGAGGILLCYDVTDPTTADNVRLWLIEIEKYAPFGIPIVLCGTKSDLKGNAYHDENVLLTCNIISDILASYPELKHCETSSKTGDGVEDAFFMLVDRMLARDIEIKRKRIAERQKTIDSNDAKGGISLKNALRVLRVPYASLIPSACSTS